MNKLIKAAILFVFRTLTMTHFMIEKLLEKVLPSHLDGFTRNYMIKKIDTDNRKISHRTRDNKMVSFNIFTPNQTCHMRHKTFSTKEPETLEWIDTYGGEGAMFDIGANIGIYSLYYAKSKPGNVYSFEPSVFNLRQLAKNISMNSLSEKVRVISNPLSSSTGISNFCNSSDDEGGALSAFGVNYGYDGKPIDKNIEYKVLGFTLDDVMQKNLVNEVPTLVKIDVDGIEHLILEGAKNTLSSKGCKSVLIEVNDNFKHQSSRVSELLKSYGFKMQEKGHSELFNSGKFKHTFNQIWVKDSIAPVV